MSNPRLALIGLGNCAAALVDGIALYHVYPDDTVGLIRPRIGPYAVGDLRVVAAFDVDRAKVGSPIADAVHASHNCTRVLMDRAERMAVTEGAHVFAAPLLDGVGETYAAMIETNTDDATTEPDRYADVLRHRGVDVLINYLPVGSEKATRFWADVALRSGCGFVNAIPVFLASDPDVARCFQEARLPLVGDDIKSQYGATILHRQLVHLAALRGFTVDRTYQLNFGGNMDFANMLDTERLTSKKQSKTNAVAAEMTEGVDHALDKGNTHIGPSDYVPWLGDRKQAYIRLEGRGFGGAPYSVELKLDVWDSPNSAGVVVDAVRYARLAMDRGLGGPLLEPSAALMKSPPRQTTDEAASHDLDTWERALTNGHVPAAR